MRSTVTSGTGKVPSTFGSCANLPWHGNTVVTRSPRLLDCCKNAHLVIHHHIVRRRIPPLDIDEQRTSARFFREPLGFLKYATWNPVRVVLIDIWIPGMSGLELQKRLRAVSPETRVIIRRANDHGSVRNAAMEAGAIAYFVKPFDDHVFLTAVLQAIASTG